MEKNSENLNSIKTKKIYFKKIFDLVEVSSCHGLPNIIRTQRYLIKIIWSLAFLTSLVYSVISIVNTINDFLNYDVVVNMELVQDFDLEFPAVTVCNYNPFDFSNDQAVRTIESYLNNITNAKENYFSFKNETITNSSCSENLRQILIRSFVKFSFPLEKMLISCFYDQKNCSKDDFYPIRSSVFGMCYSFNYGKYSNGTLAPVRKLKRSGMFNGLKLELYVGAREYLPCWIHENAAIVVVHNRAIKPLFVEESIKAPIGMETSFAVKNLKVKKLPYPHSGCIQDLYSENSFTSSAFKKNVKTYGVYTQKWCLLDCALALNTKNNAIKCLPTNFECLEDISNLSDFYSDCINECPIECESSYFSLHPNFAKYPSYSYAEHLLLRDDIKAKFPYSDPTMAQLSDSVLSLNIYYESAIYQRITETPQTTSITLISNLGGNLGLFLGVSLLSFVEIIEIFIEFLYLCFKN